MRTPFSLVVDSASLKYHVFRTDFCSRYLFDVSSISHSSATSRRKARGRPEQHEMESSSQSRMATTRDIRRWQPHETFGDGDHIERLGALLSIAKHESDCEAAKKKNIKGKKTCALHFSISHPASDNAMQFKTEISTEFD